MTAHFTDISVYARFSELPGLISDIADRASRLGIGADDSMRLQLCIEELFTNTIRHGHQGDSEHRVYVALSRSDDALILRYEDEAPPFEMTEIAPKMASTAAIGGLGLDLIRGLSKAIRQRRQGQRNITEIEL